MRPMDTLDEIAADLQHLRTAAGQVPYGEIAARIAARREEHGATPAAARIGRSSVYDVFRAGRSRTNPDLVAEVVLALGGDETAAAEWRSRCLRVGATRSPAPRSPRATPENPGIRTAFAGLLLLSCLGLNLFGHNAAGHLPVPLYLDMIGTAVAAIVLGPWRGAAVGAATSLLAAISNVPGSAAFLLVQVVGALVWGYGVRTLRLGRTPLRYVLLNVLAALACTVTAVPVIVYVFGGFTDHPADLLTEGFEAVGEGVWAAVFSSNILVSLADKLLAGTIALMAFTLITRQEWMSLLTDDAPEVWLARPGISEARTGTYRQRA